MLLQKEILTQKLLSLKIIKKKLQTFDSSYFKGKSHFEEVGVQNYLVFQPTCKYLRIGNSDYVLSWKSKGLSNESITPPSATNNFLSPSLNYLGTKIRVRFRRSCLKQDKITYSWKNSKHLHCL